MALRVAIHTLGTRGDVQPYIALALGLIRAGHTVEIAAPEQFSTMVEATGVGFAPLPRELLDRIDTPEAKAAIAKSEGFGAGFKLLRQVGPIMQRLFDAELTAARAFSPDVLLYHPKAIAAPHVAEAIGCGFALASPLPGFTPAAEFPTPLLGFSSLGPLNRISHSLMIRSSSLLFGKMLRKWRVETLGLDARPRFHAWKGVPTLYGYSPSVVPVPRDWGLDILVSGYWFLEDDADWQPPPPLAEFLAAGPPPVYVGFGSMPMIDPAATTATVVAALERVGQRAVLAGGWGGLGAGNLPKSVLAIDGAPHQQLFPLMSALVHHGGAGTTGAGLRAGKPTLIVPFFGDQPFWGRRVSELGAGPPPIPIRQLSVETLAASIRRAADDDGMRRKAELVGQAIQREDGVSAAVGFVERIAARGR